MQNSINTRQMLVSRPSVRAPFVQNQTNRASRSVQRRQTSVIVKVLGSIECTSLFTCLICALAVDMRPAALSFASVATQAELTVGSSLKDYPDYYRYPPEPQYS